MNKQQDWKHAFKKEENHPVNSIIDFYKCPKCGVEWNTSPPTYPTPGSGLSFERECPDHS